MIITFDEAYKQIRFRPIFGNRFRIRYDQKFLGDEILREQSAKFA